MEKNSRVFFAPKPIGEITIETTSEDVFHSIKTMFIERAEPIPRKEWYDWTHGIKFKIEDITVYLKLWKTMKEKSLNSKMQVDPQEKTIRFIIYNKNEFERAAKLFEDRPNLRREKEQISINIDDVNLIFRLKEQNIFYVDPSSLVF